MRIVFLGNMNNLTYYPAYELKKRGFTSAFILAEKRDENDPLFTIRRIIASGYWNTRTLHNSIVKSF